MANASTLAKIGIAMKWGLSVHCCRCPPVIYQAQVERPNEQDAKIPAVWQALFSSGSQIDWIESLCPFLACGNRYCQYAGGGGACAGWKVCSTTAKVVRRFLFLTRAQATVFENGDNAPRKVQFTAHYYYSARLNHDGTTGTTKRN